MWWTDTKAHKVVVRLHIQLDVGYFLCTVDGYNAARRASSMILAAVQMTSCKVGTRSRRTVCIRVDAWIWLYMAVHGCGTAAAQHGRLAAVSVSSCVEQGQFSTRRECLVVDMHRVVVCAAGPGRTRHECLVDAVQQVVLRTAEGHCKVGLHVQYMAVRTTWC